MGKPKKSSRSKAFFINGGAGRVLSSIPALTKYHEESGDEDFVIICEGGMDFYRGHPELHKRAYESWHKGLFENHLLDKDIISPEPYRVNAYFNQKCSIAQAFDIEINGLDGPREIADPEVILNKMEMVQGYQTVQEIRAMTKKQKVVIVQPFGRSVQQMGEFLIDSSSRSFELQNITNIIENLRSKYAVIVMSEHKIPFSEDPENQIALPHEPNMRLWAAMINSADHFLGCDSVGQHIAKALGKTATVVVGSTVPINISYPEFSDFDVIDIGKDKRRIYSPIRVSMDDERDRTNDKVMMMEEREEKMVIRSVEKFMGDGEKFTGEYIKQEDCDDCSIDSGKTDTPEPGVG